MKTIFLCVFFVQQKYNFFLVSNSLWQSASVLKLVFQRQIVNKREDVAYFLSRLRETSTALVVVYLSLSISILRGQRTNSSIFQGRKTSGCLSHKRGFHRLHSQYVLPSYVELGKRGIVPLNWGRGKGQSPSELVSWFGSPWDPLSPLCVLSPLLTTAPIPLPDSRPNLMYD